jgi:hypothetical protein
VRNRVLKLTCVILSRPCGSRVAFTRGNSTTYKIRVIHIHFVSPYVNRQRKNLTTYITFSGLLDWPRALEEVQFCEKVSNNNSVKSLYLFSYSRPQRPNNNNSILTYLRANLTAQRPITKLAREEERNNNNNSIQFLFICVPTQQPKGQL